MTKTDVRKLAKHTKKIARKSMKKKLQMLQQSNPRHGNRRSQAPTGEGLISILGTLIVLASVTASIIQIVRPKVHHLDADERQKLFETE